VLFGEDSIRSLNDWKFAAAFSAARA